MKKKILLVLFMYLTSESLFWSYLCSLDLEDVKNYISVFYIFNIVLNVNENTTKHRHMHTSRDSPKNTS